MILCLAGVEIAAQIADVAAHVYHSARTWSQPQLAQAPARGNMTRVPLLIRLHSSARAEFSGGMTVDPVDAVVYCTGYKYTYPFLEHTGLITTGSGFL